MSNPIIIEQLESEISALENAYHRLVLVVGRHGTGKTRLVRALKEKQDLPMLNLNLQLSRKLLDLTGRQRVLSVPKILDELIASRKVEIVILDNTEILFDNYLKLDPLRLFQGISRNTTIVATWNGAIEKENLCYAEPGHPEYKRYPAHGLRIISMSGSDTPEGTDRK